MKLTSATVCLTLAALCQTAYAASPAQTTFEKLKSLHGEWLGVVTTTPPDAEVQGKPAHIVLRTTSLGNAVLHELKVAGRADDPITMFYSDEDRLLLTHYRDAGNRPRMVGKMGADGKTFEFNFLDVAGSTAYGHMQNVALTTIDNDHHTEDWTFLVGEKRPCAL